MSSTSLFNFCEAPVGSFEAVMLLLDRLHDILQLVLSVVFAMREIPESNDQEKKILS
jgi:hypothetical protein